MNESFDHKFDSIDETQFIDNSIGTKLSYMGFFMVNLRDVMIYIADLGSVAILLNLNIDAFSHIENAGSFKFRFSSENALNDRVSKNAVIATVGLQVMFALIVGSLLLSFLLLFSEWKKASKIIKSRDISCALTSVVSYRFYAIRSYAHYCLFRKIQNSRRTVDVLAFWVFFKFKDWKRLVLAQFPRQFLQGVIIQSIFKSFLDQSNGNIFNAINAIINDTTGATGTVVLNVKPETKLLLILQMFTITSWLISFAGLLVAFALYPFLLTFAFQGNLKEYCVHKVDKRLEEIFRSTTKKNIREYQTAIQKARYNVRFA